ncbi:MAG: glycosyltransferase family 2 protein [Lachnospiraceae bacterium]|nr:glycosyltransferase family 2 protein [Lachnospiraceae bacterium]
MKVDVIIPVYKPDSSLFKLMDRLQVQTVPVHNIILMNTEEKYFQELISDIDFREIYPNVKVYHLSKKEFDHGGTRRRGVRKSDAEVFVMMTQDAMPKDERLIEYLLQGLQKENVAAAYARQLPREDCRPIERCLRQFNYPETSRIKSVEDLETLGIKTYFCSNVCCAYRRDIYETLGGFIRHTIFNEDMIYAAAAIKAGYRIAYVAEAEVIHSHNYTCKQQFHRNFDLGVSQAKHPEVFEGIPSEGEGIRSVKTTARYLYQQRQARLIPYLFLQSASKYMGYLLGKHYRILPLSLVYILSMNKDYWRRKEIRKIS